MTATDVLTFVDAYRPNLITQADKLNRLYAIEKEITDHMSLYGEKHSIIKEITESTVLSLPKEYLDIYVYYIISTIDLANQDIAMYNNSCTYFNTLLSEWKKRWRREHVPVSSAQNREG